MPVTYRIERVRHPVGEGTTQPFWGTVQAVLKSDGPESRYCRYNETVASRLAQAGALTVAVGVPAWFQRTLYYASVSVVTGGVPLPPVGEDAARAVARRYPAECAHITAFDVLIGNTDRADNLLAVLRPGGERMIVALDHSHCLLDCSDTPKRSLELLASEEPIARQGFLLPFLKRVRVDEAAVTIHGINPDVIRRCCLTGGLFENVRAPLQRRVADAMIARAQRIEALVRRLWP